MRYRPQINIRLDRDLLGELDDLANRQRVDRSEMARRVMDEGLASHRMSSALGQYRDGRVSTWKAAELARVSLYEMLDRIHDEGIPYDMDPEVIDRLARVGGKRRAVAEAPEAYEAGPVADGDRAISTLREQFRPDRVRTLFVGESSPAGGTHFYRADSNLFRATREAFAAAMGEDSVPAGPAFLHFFRDQGCWLVDLAERPVNRMRGRPRKDAVDQGVQRLAELIAATHPERIVVVKASIASAVRKAASAAGFDGEIVELPFPVRQWRSAYIRELAAAMHDRGETPSVRRGRR